MIEFAAIVAGWLLITIGITCYFIPSPKTGTVKGEKKLMEEKERRNNPEENLRIAERYMFPRKQTREEPETR